MKAAGHLIAQLVPGITPVQIFVAAIRTEITAIYVCNTSGVAVTFRLYHDVGGAVYAVTNALYFDKPLAVGETYIDRSESDSASIMLEIGDTLGVQCSVVDSATFSIYGVGFIATGTEM